MNRQQQPAVIAFALGLIGLGTIGLIYRDFALLWQPVPATTPGQTLLAGLFAASVWLPMIWSRPTGRLPWTAFFITWLFAAGAWVVSHNIPIDRKEA